MVRDYLIKQYGENTVFQGRLKVYTTLIEHAAGWSGLWPRA